MKLFHPLKQLLSPVVMNHSTPLHVIITPWFAVNIWTISVDSVRLINPPRARRSQESHTHHYPSTFHFLACCLATDTVMCFLSCNWNTTTSYFLKQKSEKTEGRYFESRRGAGPMRGVLEVSFVFFVGENNGAPEMPDAIAISLILLLLQSPTANVAIWLDLILEAIQIFNLLLVINARYVLVVGFLHINKTHVSSFLNFHA